MADIVRTFPIGCRVRSTIRAHMEYQDHFPDLRAGYQPLTGTVIGHSGPSVHVSWDGDFNGHSLDDNHGDPLPGDAAHTGGCWYMEAREIEWVEGLMTGGMTETIATNTTATTVTTFPIGSIVENISSMAIGSRYDEPDRLGVTRRGTVIVKNESDGSQFVHVDFGDGFRGHVHSDVNINCNGHCWLLLPEELRMIVIGPVMDTMVVTSVAAAPIPPPIPRLRVTIARNMSGYGTPWQYRIENGPSVTKYEMKAAMDKRVASKVPARTWNHRDIQYIVNAGITDYGIDPQVFVDAITAAAIAKQARDGHGPFVSENVNHDSDIAAALAGLPVLVAIGDRMFSLQPRGVIDGSRALKIIKDRYTTIAKAAVDKIKLAAKAEADGMIANGERQLREARLAIERERDALARSVENVMVIPEWIAVNGLKIVRYDGGSSRREYNLMVGIDINTMIKSIQLPHTWYDDPARERGIHSEIVKWRPRSIPHYHQVTAWMPFSSVDGKYNYGAMKLIDGSDNPWQLPHLGTNRCCMALQGMPTVMKDYDSYKKISAIINRGNSEINLNSLLHGYNKWHPDIQGQIPVNVKRILDNGVHETVPDSWLTDAERVPVEVEASETFNVDRLREIRTARGEELPVELGEHLLVDAEVDDETDDQLVREDEEAANG